MQKIFVCVICGLIVMLGVPGNAFAGEYLTNVLDNLFDEASTRGAIWAARVETSTGEVLYDRLGSSNCIPASNMKVLTTAAAMALLGPDYRYETQLKAVGDIQADGTLRGNLLIVGSGDPSLGSWHLEGASDGTELMSAWVRKIQAAGIKRITGDVIGDGRIFTEEFQPGIWDLEDLCYWYGAGSSGVAFEENCFRFWTSPGSAIGEPAKIKLVPNTGYVEIVNHTRTVDRGGEKNADVVWRDIKGNRFIFEGTVPIDAKPYMQRGAIYDGNRYCAYVLKEALQREGIIVEGEALNIRQMADSRIEKLKESQKKILATWVSPDLTELVRIVNKTSHNFFADQILRTLGVENGKQGDFKSGAQVVKDWLRKENLPGSDSVVMRDGSGLARLNLVQPGLFCALFRKIHQDYDWAGDFEASLPVYGEQGDMKNRKRQPILKGRVIAKTGYISQVRSLTGMIMIPDAEPVYISILVNHQLGNLYQADEVIDKACALIYKSLADQDISK